MSFAAKVFISTAIVPAIDFFDTVAGQEPPESFAVPLVGMLLFGVAIVVAAHAIGWAGKLVGWVRPRHKDVPRPHTAEHGSNESR